MNGEWPFGYDELKRYYPEAADILNVPEAVHTHPERPFPDNPNIVYKPYFFSDPPVRFNSLFRNWIQQNASVDILFNHTVTGIRIENGVALSVFVQESSHNLTTPVEIFGKRIVLAAGGVQNPRLLQLSLPHELPVGLFFCVHPHLEFYIRLILDEKNSSRSPPSFHPGSASSTPFSCHLHSLTHMAFYPQRLMSQGTLGHRHREPISSAETEK